MQWTRNVLRWCVLAALATVLFAEEHRGVVRFGGLPVPGASVVVTQAGRKTSTITGANGEYTLPVDAAAPFVIEVTMQLFAPARRDFANTAAPAEWDLELLPQPQIVAQSVLQVPGRTATPSLQRTETNAAQSKPETPRSEQAPPPAPEAAQELAQSAADGFLISGSVNNAASSPFAQSGAFGNNRRGQRSLYNGNAGVILNNSFFDARAYSLTGQDTPKPAYSRIQAVVAFGGPLRIPKLLRNGPMFTVTYQWMRNSNATTRTGLMPTADERAGIFQEPITDPATGQPFPGNTIPASRISPQATSLLQLYPSPNFAIDSRYNFQLPIVSGHHQDDLQVRGQKQQRRNYYQANFSWQSIRTDSPDLFGLLETGSVSGINAGASYRRALGLRTFLTASISYSRLTTEAIPFFSERRNVSGEAGVGGNNQEPENWGPPNLSFSNGITPLTMSQASLTRNQTAGFSADLFTARGGHNVQTGFSLRRQQFNVLSQQDARGSFSFTGAAAGNDFAGFLLGIPDASAIAFGNADKYLRGRITEAYVNDDWRVNPSLTFNAGVRWEYWSPVSEKYGRLVNLDIGPGFTTATPGDTLPQPDRNNFAPRIAFSYRPASATSTVIRGGYGIYFDTSIYQPIAMQMAQQAPLSTSLRVSNSPETPLTLANGFSSSGDTSPTTFGVDPRFRVGYSQTWRISIQRDLPGALQATASYTGAKGTRAQQQFLPNTFPLGAVPPTGYTYLTSNGNSIRHAGNFQLRRRLRSGLTAQVQYTWAKSLDDALLGGRGRPMIAQDWLNLRAERGRSQFDQRHLLEANIQYTPGMGLRGGALARGWQGAALKEWTFGSQITVGSGLPLTPVFVGAVQGTGVTGTLRPDYTGAPLYDAPPGLSLNPAAYASPASGTWGSAGRNSINGPHQFLVNASVMRTFRPNDKISMDVRADATNVTNTPTFPSWNAVAGNAQFGLPNATNQMRTIQLTVRARF